MRKIECPELNASHWGLTDLYPEVAALLKAAIESGEAFETEWFSSKKKPASWKLTRHEDGGKYLIEVTQDMDEGEELIYDATPDDVELTDDEIAIVDELIMGDFCFSSTAKETATLPCNSTLEEILECVSKCYDATNEVLEHNFAFVEGTVKQIIEQRSADGAAQQTIE